MNRPKPQPAFTLIELLLAATVTALVLGSAVLVFRGVAAGQARTDAQANLQQQARAAAGAVVAALRNAHRPEDSEDAELEGIDDRIDGRPADRLRLFSVRGGVIRPGQPESDVREVEFFLAEPRDDRPAVLMRRIDPTRNPEPDGGGVVERVASNVVALDFEYLDANVWVERWDESREEWPRAVRFRLMIAATGGAGAKGPKTWPVSRLVNFVRYSGGRGEGGRSGEESTGGGAARSSDDPTAGGGR